ncbi:MAG: GNAT family N-acetyltransferase [Actinomycetota bacterium]|nr:GNAT family N-acetyltransferase [Actinomycetota bacterium]
MIESPTPVTAETRIRTVTATEVPQVTDALAHAFYDDPVAVHCLADPARRLRRLQGGFGIFLHRHYLAHDECFTTLERNGAAIWAPPGEWKLGGAAQLRMLPAMARCYGRETLRVVRLFDYIEHRHPAEPHFYLAFLGVEPASQGRGIGSALLRPVLERCDRDGVPAYLEASSPRNRVLYERHGFAVVEEIALPGNGPPMWRMWREPADADGGAGS